MSNVQMEVMESEVARDELLNFRSRATAFKLAGVESRAMSPELGTLRFFWSALLFHSAPINTAPLRTPHSTTRSGVGKIRSSAPLHQIA